MSGLLELAEHYYVVARDLEFHARRHLEVAELLNRTADRLCEENMRRSPMPESTADTSSATPPK
jgi:hypothetical protein